MYSCKLGYYGKLPVSAEFIRCQASGPEIDELDRWIRAGLYHAKSSLGSAWSKDFAKKDAWRFLYLPRHGNRFLTGLLKLSQDKAGREFPFLVYLLLDREEFHDVPWCAPMHFKEFFEQSHRLLSDISDEFNVDRLQFRLQALLPVEAPEVSSVETRYHSELLSRRMRDHWAALFGDFEDGRKYQLCRSLLRGTSGLIVAGCHQWDTQLPLLPENKEETYDVPFWIDVASHVSEHKLEAGIVLWNRWPQHVEPLLLISGECPSPQLLLYLIHPESWQNRPPGVDESVDPLTEAGQALLEDGEVTLEAFLHRASCLRS